MDLQGLIEEWIAARDGNRNIEQVLSPVKNWTWETSPAVMHRCFQELIDLWTLLFALAPNGMVPRKNLYQALQAVHEKDPIMYVVRDVKHFCG